MPQKPPRYETIIFDLDGTLFVGDKVIPGAPEAIAVLQEHFTCRFLSNNGERTGASLATRLNAMGFEVAAEELISSADLVVKFLEETQPGARVLVRASDELAQALKSSHFRIVEGGTADFVVIGVDRGLTRDKMVIALRSLLEGAQLVATNSDPTYPASDGQRPAAGAYVGIFRGMGYEPVRFCGKPDPRAVQSALRRWGIVDPSTCLFVGDNLRTDIAAARAVGADSALVLTGVSGSTDARADDLCPTYVVEDIGALPDELAGARPGIQGCDEAMCCTNARKEM